MACAAVLFFYQERDMIIIYIGMVLFTIVICGLILWHLHRTSTRCPTQTSERPSRTNLSDWSTVNAIPMVDLFTKAKPYYSLESWMIASVVEDITLRDEFIEELKKDLNLLEVYHPELTVKHMLVFVTAYILMNKVPHSVSEQEVQILRQFDFVRKTRTADQAKAILDDLASEPTRLVTVVVERRLLMYATLDSKRHELLMLNIAQELCRIASETQ